VTNLYKERQKKCNTGRYSKAADAAQLLAQNRQTQLKWDMTSANTSVRSLLWSDVLKGSKVNDRNWEVIPYVDDSFSKE